MESRNYSPDMIEAARSELSRRRQAAQSELDRRSQDNSFLGEASKVPGYALDAALKLPAQIFDLAKEVPGAIGKLAFHPINSARDVAGGVARGSQNLASSLLEGGEYLTRKGAEGIGRTLGKTVNVPKWNSREFMGLEGNNKIDLGKYLESENPNPILSGLGQYGLGGALGAGKGSLGFIGSNALNMALQSPPGHRIQSGVEGAIGTAIPIGLAKGANSLRPSRLLSGNLTPEQLQANLEAAEGTTTGLGDVIGSPGLKRVLENVLPRVPFSKADQKMQGTANQLLSKGQEHISKLGEGLPEGNLGQYLQDALKQASREATKSKNSDYQKVNNISDEIGLLINRNNFKSKAKEILKKINSSPDLKRELNSEFISDIYHYAKPENQRMGNDALVNPVEHNLSTSNILKGKLNDKANEFYSNNNNYEYSLMRELKEALDKDIKDSISNSNSDSLKNAYSKAQKNFSENYAPFEDRDITKFIKQGGDSDLILSHFLRTGANDRSNLLSKVTSKLPEELKNLPAYMYLSKAIEGGELNPLKMRTLYKNLGENQLKTLIPDENMRNALKKYTKSVGMNTESFQTMFNPKTGQRVSDLIPTIGAMTGYSMAGGGLPGLIGGAAGIALPGLAGRATTGFLTNPNVRENLVKAIIKYKQKQKQ